MRRYSYITQAKLDGNGRLEEVLIHQAMEFDADTHTLDAGKAMRAPDLVDLIARGQIVYISRSAHGGRYKAEASVVRKHGTNELICLANWGMVSDAFREIRVSDEDTRSLPKRTNLALT